MRRINNLSFLFFLLLPTLCVGQINEEFDRLFLDLEKVDIYSWGYGHVSERIWLQRDSQVFMHYFRDDLWVERIGGTFSLKADTLILECKTNCHFDIQSPIPIVVPIYAPEAKDKFLFYSTQFRKLLPYEGTITRDKEKQTAEVSIFVNQELKYVIPVDIKADGFKVYFAHQFDSYNSEDNYTKRMIISPNQLTDEDVVFKKEEMVESKQKKKRKRY